MGRLIVREAVASYLANAGLAYVGKVHPARPEIIQEDDYDTNRFNEAVASASGSSAVLVVNIPDDRRQRRADTGRGAVNDTYVHKIAMEVYFANVSGEAIAAQLDYDTVIDEMVALIRANATLNSASVWSAGEYEAGINHVQGAPFTGADGLTTFILGGVTFEAWEWIAGNV